MSAVPKWFGWAAVAALLWNLLGCAAFGADLLLTPEEVARLPEKQRNLYDTRPAWSVVATGVAVLGGTLGSIGLLRRRPWSLVFLAMSLVGIVAQDVSFFLYDGGAALTVSGAIPLQAAVLGIGVLLVGLAGVGTRKGWLA